jgi:hypothetical protein
VAPELAYVTARYAALAPFGKVAALLSELLPVSGVGGYADSTEPSVGLRDMLDAHRQVEPV